MGGGGLPSPSKAIKAAFDDPLEWNRLQLDPGGLFGASSNETFAEAQGMIDIGGIGAQKDLTQRANERQAQASLAQQEQMRLDAIDREMEARRLAASQKPLEEVAKLNIGAGTGNTNLGSLGLIVEPKTGTKRGSSVGLSGVDITSAKLGFGTKGKA